ncbi:MAG: hypothetical protein C0172_00670 [Caldisphaera sp.]|nr:MAG: hypothetical protein C0172_00670 [Caldisphaera sp.]
MINVPFFIKDYKEGKYENTYIYMYVTAEFYNGGLRCFLVGKPISKQVYNAFLKVAKFEKTLGIIGNNENDMLEQGIDALEEVRKKYFLPVAYKYGRMTSKLIEKGYAEDRT